MNRGDLRDRITFQFRAPVVDSSGAPIQDPNTGEISYQWTFKAKSWANVQFLSARELMAAQQLQSAISARITIPWRNDIDPTMRIIHGSYVYDIAGLIPDNDSGREWLTIPVTNGKNSG